MATRPLTYTLVYAFILSLLSSITLTSFFSPSPRQTLLEETRPMAQLTSYKLARPESTRPVTNGSLVANGVSKDNYFLGAFKTSRVSNNYYHILFLGKCRETFSRHRVVPVVLIERISN